MTLEGGLKELSGISLGGYIQTLAYSGWFLQIAFPTFKQKKTDLLACEESHHAPVSREDCQFHQITKHTEDLQQELLVGERHVNTFGTLVDFFLCIYFSAAEQSCLPP